MKDGGGLERGKSQSYSANSSPPRFAPRSLGNVLAPLALSILTSPHIDQVNGRAKDNRGQFAAVNSPQQLSPRTAAWLTNPPRLAAYGAHIFDHREALKQTRQSLHNPPPARRGSSPSNSAPRNSAPNTPSPMSAKQVGKSQEQWTHNECPLTMLIAEKRARGFEQSHSSDKQRHGGNG